MTMFSGQDLMEILSKPVLLLATLGGAAAGAVGSGLIAQLTTRWLTMKKLPPLPTAVARGAGGLALGLLTALWVWQGGGGSGGPGGVGVPGNFLEVHVDAVASDFGFLTITDQAS